MACESGSKHPGLLALIGVTTWLALGPAPAEAAARAASRNVQVELFSAQDSIQPSVPFWLALRLQHAPGWHTYWLNPGDSGLPTRMTWRLPEGFRASPFHWPAPEPIVAEPLVSLGYEGTLVLLTEITPPASLATGSVTLAGRLDWLECQEACLPGRAELDLVLPVSAAAPAVLPAPSGVIEQARRALPRDGSAWNMRAQASAETVALAFQPPAGITPRAARFAPEVKQLVDYARPQRLLRGPDGAWRLELAPAANPSIPERLTGVLVVQTPADTLALRVDTALAPLTSALPAATLVTTTGLGGVLSDTATAARSDAGPSASAVGLPLALLLAFVGGLILNLMPCVLPVLSLKVLSIVQQSGGARGAALRHGLAYTAGVLVSFWLLAGLLLALRAGGQQIGWGFQLQSPAFVVALVCLFFLIGLNLFGVFEVGVSLTATGGALTRPSGASGAFMSGALATLVATPCTAPFMGSALGFALTQPAWAALLVFTTLALGMALPYLVLSGSPGLLRFVPRPGAWMETFKQLMGFFMMGAVVVLLWVFGQQVGVPGLVSLLATLVLLALAAWIYGRGTAPGASTRQVRMAMVLGSLTAAAALFVGFGHAVAAQPETARGTRSEDGLVWQAWSNEAVAAARAQGQPVLVDFTAAWCLTCQVNERVALAAPEVRARLLREKVVLFRADWTRRDDAITAALASYGRSGVPVYVLYGRGRSEPYLLPEVLSPGLVLAALDRQL